mmetsp:Transcript_1615/g.2139  ORF Transcript_1615/g.2139 Transcript_1615/m.2139 type:complete len:641 (-) Transcript_1615:58-1980(-)
MSSSSHSKHRRSLAISNSSNEARSQSIIRERDAQIASLQMKINSLTNKLVTLNRQFKASKRQHHELQGGHSAQGQGQGQYESTPKRKHRLSPYGNVVHETNVKNRTLTHERSRMGRNASIATAAELSSLDCPKEESRHSTNQAIVMRILEMFKDPSSHIQYLRSREFANDLLKLNSKIRSIFESEPRVAFLQSPVYVFGDIHGNLEDLHFFSDNIWRLGMSLTAGNFVFLGDYVDRGMSCLEVIAYLFAMKLLLPHKVFLLRGNHETRDVNGWEEHYKERSFLFQCCDRFGEELGHKVWEQINSAFDRMPLAAVIDQDIFCVHGGIPRPITETEDGSLGSRVQDILNVPRVAGINPPYEHEDEHYQQVASDCIWSDPASEEQERTGVDPQNGYGQSLRGGGAICFGHRAVKDFLEQHNFSYIMRAHEAHADGVAVSKGGKVFTIFSTSKDHNQGSKAMAGCILVDFENLQVINRSHAYRNMYVHRRDSVSIAKLTEGEIQQRMRLGLVTDVGNQDDDDEVFEDSEEWEDIDEEEEEEDSEEENYIFSSRRSSVIPGNTMNSPAGVTTNSHQWMAHDEITRSDSRSSESSVDYIQVDFKHVETSNRKKKRECLRFSTIDEKDDDDSTVKEEDAMEFDDGKF